MRPVLPGSALRASGANRQICSVRSFASSSRISRSRIRRSSNSSVSLPTALLARNSSPAHDHQMSGFPADRDLLPHRGILPDQSGIPIYPTAGANTTTDLDTRSASPPTSATATLCPATTRGATRRPAGRNGPATTPTSGGMRRGMRQLTASYARYGLDDPDTPEGIRRRWLWACRIHRQLPGAVRRPAHLGGTAQGFAAATAYGTSLGCAPPTGSRVRRRHRRLIDHLDRNCRIFIARSPFRVLGNASADGQADASPRGDPCCCPTVRRTIGSTRSRMWSSNRGSAC